MGLYRVFPTSDTWITDAHPVNDFSQRATGSNHGASPSLNVFARKGDINSASIELARSLLRFNIDELSSSIYEDGTIPSSGVSYYLKMFDHTHGETTPTSYDLFVFPLSRSWDEGLGIDDDNLEDAGYANWLSASSTVAWETSGSDYISSGFGSGTMHFDRGTEDLEVDVTDIVVNWLTGALEDNGVVVKMSDSNESNSVNYYRKAFHGRESMFVDKLPYLEARWEDVVKDNRKNFAFDLTGSLYLYNVVRGEAVDAEEPIEVQVKDSLQPSSASFSQSFTATRAEEGIYSTSFVLDSTGSYSASFYDIWTDASGRVLRTGSFVPVSTTGSSQDVYSEFAVNMNNLKAVYNTSEEARFFVNVRNLNYNTHKGILRSASLDVDREYMENMYYSLLNDETGETVIPFGTGSVKYTKLSYDGNGNYFDFWMQSLVPGFKYRFLFLIEFNKNDKKVIDDDFTFRVS